jgi:peroxiredoxin
MLAVPSFLALACAGGLLAVAFRAKSARPQQELYEPKHLVTADMMVKTTAMKARDAKTFSVKGVDGRAVLIAGAGLKRPQFVYFIHTDCPCSYAAEPLFHDLANRYKGQIDVVSVTNGTPDVAKKWIAEMDVDYPVVSDPKAEIMKAYGAVSSAYSALVGTDGKIDKMWPGFSRDMLLDINHEMARLTQQPELPFDTQYAPLKPATGCSF